MADKKTNNPRKTLAQITKDAALKDSVPGAPSMSALSEGDAEGKENSSRPAAHSSQLDNTDFPAEEPSGSAQSASAALSDSSRLDEIFSIDDMEEDSAAQESASPDASGASTADAASVAKRPHKARKSRSKDDKRVSREKTRHRWKLVRNILIAIFALIVVGAVVAFGVFRWGACDDAADLEGVWQIEGSGATVTIDDGRFVLTDDIAYRYEIDPVSKTLTFGFGNLSGSARYRFSADRNMISIEDGEFDGISNMMGDIPWTFDVLMNAIQGQDAKDPKLSDDSMTLKRVG